MLSDKFQKIEEFLVLAAILAGVQSLQRNSVTRDQLKHLVELQREEFHQCVRAETEHLHNAISQMHSNVEKLSHDTHQVSERMGKLEGRISQSSGVGEPLRDHNDPAYAQIAFLDIPVESSVSPIFCFFVYGGSAHARNYGRLATTTAYKTHRHGTMTAMMKRRT